MRKIFWILIILVGIVIVFLLLNSANEKEIILPDRESKIPSETIKMTFENDVTPPKLLSSEFENPVALPYPVNTRGAEDSAFVMPDGKMLYVWFTPNTKMDAVEQSQDLVTGIYKFEKKSDGSWSEPERIWLVKPGEPHLDGCGFFQGNKVWVCGARKGYTGLNWFSSEFEEGKWSISEIVEFPKNYEVGELHISKDGNEIYYHSSRAGGKGGLDIWKIIKNADGTWSEPENVEEVNTERDEGWPALNPQENELWIYRDYAIWRSKKISSVWSEPEKIVSDLAGEATIDEDGNVYFTHHYYKDGKMLEADIYIVEKIIKI